MHPHDVRNGTSDRYRDSEVRDEYATDTQSTDQKRNNRIPDALETRYHKSGIGRLLFSEPSSRRRTRSMEGTWQRLSSATRIDETSVPEELPQDSRINTTTKVRPTVSVAKKYTELHDTTMFYPNMNENIINQRMTTGSTWGSPRFTLQTLVTRYVTKRSGDLSEDTPSASQTSVSCTKLYSDQCATVLTDNDSDEFPIARNTKQGDPLSSV